MISFRFHVVSITAIFLAIAIGIVVGSTYVDGAVVDALRNRINTVSDNLTTRQAENDRLERELGSADEYIDASADFAVTGRLTGVAVLLVAVRGIDEGVIEDQVAKARRAGAEMPGVVWLEPAWSLESDDDRQALAELVGGQADDAAEVLWTRAWDGLVAELVADAPAEEGADVVTGTEPEGPTTTTTIVEPTSELVDGLEAAGFLTVDSLDDASSSLADLAGTSPRVLVVTGTRAQPELVPMVPLAVEATAQGGLSTVVADVHVDAPEAVGRGEALVSSLPDDVRALVVLLDHADQTEGRVGAVLALDAVADDQVNGLHFGYGDGAEGVLPPWTAP